MTRFDLQHEMATVNRDLEKIFRGFALPRTLAAAAPPRLPSPLTLRETAAGYALEAAIPGIDPATLEMTIHKDTLTLRGERSVSAPENAAWHRRERETGPFERTLRLPEGIDGEKAHASCKNGILSVTLPRAQSALPRKITIEAA